MRNPVPQGYQRVSAIRSIVQYVRRLPATISRVFLFQLSPRVTPDEYLWSLQALNLQALKWGGPGFEVRKKKRDSRPFIPTTTKEELQRIAGYSFDLIQEEGLCLDCIKAGGIYNGACRVGHEKIQENGQSDGGLTHPHEDHWRHEDWAPHPVN